MRSFIGVSVLALAVLVPVSSQATNGKKTTGVHQDAGPLGSIGNPIIMKAGQIFGPQNEYGLRLVGDDQRVLGQFTEPVEFFGVTLYEWVQTP